jgi:hypothetical protein
VFRILLESDLDLDRATCLLLNSNLKLGSGCCTFVKRLRVLQEEKKRETRIRLRNNSS